MMNFILDLMTWALVFFLTSGIVFGVVVFVMAATWMQVNDGKGTTYEQKESAQSGSAHPAAKRRRRASSACHPCEMP